MNSRLMNTSAIAHHGAEAAHFGVVVNGTIRVSVVRDGGTQQTLERLLAGHTFNERASTHPAEVTGDFRRAV